MQRLAVLAFLVSTVVLAAQNQAPIEWPYWGADQAQTKYSAAAQITR